MPDFIRLGRQSPDPEQKRKTSIALGISFILVAAVSVVVITVSLTGGGSSEKEHLTLSADKDCDGEVTTFGSRSASLSGSNRRWIGTYRKAAVSVDGQPCAGIGLDVLKRNGTVVDAAIAALFCNGVQSSQSMGIGGGFVMLVYQKSTGKVVVLNAREMAPSEATFDLFNSSQFLSSTGPLSVAVPGEVRGYYEAKMRYGNPEVSWMSLIEPSIKMCKQGITVSSSAAKNLKDNEEYLHLDPGLREIFINPVTKRPWKTGDVYKREKFAETLFRIGQNGPDEFYSGLTANKMVQELSDLGGIITLEDLREYRAVWEDPEELQLSEELKVYGASAPSSGPVLRIILDILRRYNIQPGQDDPLLYHRITEAFKWAYAYRSRLGDPSMEPAVKDTLVNITSEEVVEAAFRKIDDETTFNDPTYYDGLFVDRFDKGTSHTSVLAPNGDAVSVTSTINLHFGAKIMSPSTGVIFNDEMDDFSSPNIINEFNLPPSPFNFIKPGKRPMSSMSPTIVVNDKTGDVRLVVGAAGGTKITSAIALTIVRNIWLGQDLKEAIDLSRIHHQLVPMRVDCEEGLLWDIAYFLSSRGHSICPQKRENSAVMAVSVEQDGKIRAYSDLRKHSGIAGF